MQQFDYSATHTASNELSSLIEELSRSEKEQVLEAVKDIKKESQQIVLDEWENVIETTILPALKRYAEATFSVLETDFQKSSFFIATFKNDRGFDICNNTAMKYLLAMADNIEINTNDDWITLSLIFSAT